MPDQRSSHDPGVQPTRSAILGLVGAHARKFARRIDCHTASDVDQEVALGICRQLGTLGAEAHEVDEVFSAPTLPEAAKHPVWRRIGIHEPKAWICRICKNKFADLIRKRRRSRLRAGGELIEPPAPSAADESARETVDMLRSLLDPRQWRVLNLRFFEGYSVREIAELVGEGYEAVKKQLQRAYADARAILERAERREGGSSSASPEFAF